MTTHVGVLIDESGSMLISQMTTISSFNEYISALKAQMVDYRVSLTTFNSISGVKERCIDLPISDMRALTANDYQPDGQTPLYDATAKMISSMASRAGKDLVIICIITDGQDNASREYRMPQTLQALIKMKENVDKWAFVFIGADLSRSAVSQYANEMGINTTNTVSAERSQIKGVFEEMARGTRSYVSSNGGTQADIFNTGGSGTATLDEIKARGTP